MGEHEAPREPLFDEIKARLGIGGDDDHADWDVQRHGRMADHATGSEGEPITAPWESASDTTE